MSLLQLPSECILSVLTRLPVSEVVAIASCCSGGCQINRVCDQAAWHIHAALAWSCACKSRELSKGHLNEGGMFFFCPHAPPAALRQLAQDDCFWADLAEAKWGTAARQLKANSEQQPKDNDANEDSKVTLAAADPSAGQGSWQRYCYKRMSARTIRWVAVAGRL